MSWAVVEVEAQARQTCCRGFEAEVSARDAKEIGDCSREGEVEGTLLLALVVAREVVVDGEKKAGRSGKLVHGLESEQTGSARERRTVGARNRPCRWLQTIRSWRCFSVLILAVDGFEFAVRMLRDNVDRLFRRRGLLRKASQDLVVELCEIFVARGQRLGHRGHRRHSGWW